MQVGRAEIETRDIIIQLLSLRVEVLEDRTASQTKMLREILSLMLAMQAADVDAAAIREKIQPLLRDSGNVTTPEESAWIDKELAKLRMIVEGPALETKATLP